MNLKKATFAALMTALIVSNVFAEGVRQQQTAPVGFAKEVAVKVFPLERNGIALHLAQYQTQDGDKKPILLVHGLTYSSHEFDVNYADYSLTRYLANNGYAVWLLDIAGYGDSGAVEDGFTPNSDYAADDIAAAVNLINAISGTKKIDVLGWSWGTVTSGRFAAKYPELVNKLVLYAPIVAGLADVKVTDAFHINDWFHAADDFQKNKDGSINYEIIEPSVADTFLSNCWLHDGHGSPNGGRRDLLVAPTKRLIPTADIKAPTLLILGGKDDYVSVELAQEAMETLTNKDSDLKVINGAAHAMMMEKPYYKIFRESVLAFLTK
jgi:pimeloyl-ACP methyl ester carboxylesterase